MTDGETAQAAQVVTVAATLLGVVVGAFLGPVVQRWVQGWGNLKYTIDNWWVQAGTAGPTEGSRTAEERRLQVTFLNWKQLPVTVWDMRVVFYKGGEPLEDWTRPSMVFVDDAERMSLLSPVNLPSRISVTRTMRLVPGSADARQALEEADSVMFEATVVGAKDISKELTPWQDFEPWKPSSEAMRPWWRRMFGG